MKASDSRDIFDGFLFRYVRIVGTHNTVNRVFHLVSFECLYTTQPFKLDSGILGKNLYVKLYIYKNLMHSEQCLKLAVGKSYQILGWATENFDHIA